MWQSLVTIGPETSEIRRRKKSKRIETSAVKYNGRRPASWRAAIIMRLHNTRLTQCLEPADPSRLLLCELVRGSVANRQIVRASIQSMPANRGRLIYRRQVAATRLVILCHRDTRPKTVVSLISITLPSPDHSFPV